jgi:hypothetical protein
VDPLPNEMGRIPPSFPFLLKRKKMQVPREIFFPIKFDTGFDSNEM